jgi:outer membrane protein OmpA-like peptidoglycan-associated protein
VENDYDAWCKLMYSYMRGGIWSTPEPFWFVEEGINYGHPAFAANGTTLFFSSDDTKGLGSHDLYISQYDEAEGWSEPVNLGAAINTSGREQYPTVFMDTLFFSSDKIAGLGGLDIFKTYLGADGNWVPPINLRAPINSGADDFGFVIDTFTPRAEGTLMQGYFTSSREGGSGNDDIYAFAVKGKTVDIDVAETPEDEVQEEELIDYQLYLVLKVMEPQYKVQGDPNSPKVGKRALPNGPVIVSDGLTDQRFVTDELGQFLIRLEWGKEYTFTAKYRDHLSMKYTLNTAEIEKDKEKPQKTINQILELDPIFINKEIVIDNIFYDFDQWAIREDARPPLDQLSIILKNNPQINIQISSYTDCRGTDEYNLELSQKRAEAAVEYLKSTGIPGRRLSAQGYGESNLVIKCVCEDCTEEQHQANRLTTFKIID